MRLHQVALRVRERTRLLKDLVGNPDLADVVEEETVFRARVFDDLGVDHPCELGRVALDTL